MSVIHHCLKLKQTFPEAVRAYICNVCVCSVESTLDIQSPTTFQVTSKRRPASVYLAGRHRTQRHTHTHLLIPHNCTCTQTHTIPIHFRLKKIKIKHFGNGSCSLDSQHLVRSSPNCRPSSQGRLKYIQYLVYQPCKMLRKHVIVRKPCVGFIYLFLA